MSSTINISVGEVYRGRSDKLRQDVTFPSGITQDWLSSQVGRRDSALQGQPGTLVATVEAPNEDGWCKVTYPSGWVSDWSVDTLRERGYDVPAEAETASTGVAEEATFTVAAEAEADSFDGAAQAIVEGLFGTFLNSDDAGEVLATINLTDEVALQIVRR